MAIIGGNLGFNNDPSVVLKNYMKTNGITDEAQAKKELEALYGKPERKLLIPKRNDLRQANLDFLSANANYALGAQGVTANDNQQPVKQQTQIEGFLKNAGYENLSEIAKLLGNANIEVTYGNKVPCLQIFDENKNCIGHMYLDSFIENGEEQKNKLIIYGNNTKPTTVFKFNAQNKLEQIYDSNGNVTNIPAKQESRLAALQGRGLALTKEKADLEFKMLSINNRKVLLQYSQTNRNEI